MEINLLQNIVERFDRLNRLAEEPVVSRIKQALASAFSLLESQLSRLWSSYSAIALPTLTAAQRGLLLFAELQTSLNLLTNQPQALFTDLLELLKTAIRNGIAFSSELLRSLASSLTATATNVASTVRTAAEGAWRRIVRHTEDFKEKAAVIVTQGLTQGWGFQKAASVLRERLGTTQAQTEMVTRTETLAASNDAAIANYQANGVTGWQFIATAADIRTCPVCVARTGNVYDYTVQRPPIHPRCRCYAVPWDADLPVDAEGWRNLKAQAIANLAMLRIVPDYGVSPFERMTGMTTPPTPIWQP